MPQTEAELAALWRCAERGTPFGDEAWVRATAVRLGLEFTLRPPGRPPRTPSLGNPENIASPLFDRLDRPAEADQ